MASREMHLEIHCDVLQGSPICQSLLSAAALTHNEHKSDEKCYLLCS